MADSEYDKKSGVIRELASLPPDQLIDRLSQLHPGVSEVAPNIAPHIHAVAMNAVQFLNNRLPKGGAGLLQDKVPSPSIAEKNQWLDLHGLVNDPVSALSHVNNNTINRHHLEALQAIYPDLHQEMIAKIQETLGKMKLNGQQLPYQKRLSIAKFTGMPLDSTMIQPNMQAILVSASVNNGPQAQGMQKQAKASGPELTQLNKVNALSQTPSQAREVQKNK